MGKMYKLFLTRCLTIICYIQTTEIEFEYQSSVCNSKLQIDKHGLLLRGHDCTILHKLQKPTVHSITYSKYNAHTEPLHKTLNILIT